MRNRDETAPGEGYRLRLRTLVRGYTVLMKWADFENPNGRFYNADTFEAMAALPDGCVDMLLVDLPYGTTACAWDTVLPLDELWYDYRRLCKKDAAMVLTSSQPFTSLLINSNINNFKYSWYWKKRPVNFLNAKKTTTS
jgi:site-specific DNA-methyltransferase (adenine-specific)